MLSPLACRTRIQRLMAVFAVAMALMSGPAGCSRPAQVVDDEDCFQAVDALWTAVTSKRSDLLEQTAAELDRLQSVGSLSEDGHRELNEIVTQARSAEWETSAKMLKAFMLGQRKTRST